MIMIAMAPTRKRQQECTSTWAEDYGCYDNWISLVDSCYYETKVDVPEVEIVQRVFNYRHDLVLMLHNAYYKLKLSILFNIYATFYYRRMLFDKSGFIGRVAKRRKS